MPDSRFESLRLNMWRPLIVNYGITFACSSHLNLKIADRELAMKAEVEKTLDYIYRQLGQLRVVNDLPDTGVTSEPLMNRALDVRSAVMTYIAIHIRHDYNPLGIGGMAALGSCGVFDYVREDSDKLGPR